MRFNKAAYEYIKQSIKALDSLRLSVEERLWLRRTCPYFPQDYLEWLSHFKLDSDKEVKLAFKQEENSDFGELDIASAYSVSGYSKTPSTDVVCSYDIYS
jgi:nicotinate phosphoribosyltransferase